MTTTNHAMPNNPYSATEGAMAYEQDEVAKCPNCLLDLLDWALANLCTPATHLCGIGMRVAGPIFVLGFYYLMLYHTWIFLTIIATVMRVRLGTELAVLWTLIGIVITYNVVWNHTLAMVLRPGSPKDLIVSGSICQLSLKHHHSSSSSVLRNSGPKSKTGQIVPNLLRSSKKVAVRASLEAWISTQRGSKASRVKSKV